MAPIRTLLRPIFNNLWPFCITETFNRPIYSPECSICLRNFIHSYWMEIPLYLRYVRSKLSTNHTIWNPGEQYAQKMDHKTHSTYISYTLYILRMYEHKYYTYHTKSTSPHFFLSESIWSFFSDSICAPYTAHPCCLKMRPLSPNYTMKKRRTLCLPRPTVEPTTSTMDTLATFRMETKSVAWVSLSAVTRLFAILPANPTSNWRTMHKCALSIWRWRPGPIISKALTLNPPSLFTEPKSKTIPTARDLPTMKVPLVIRSSTTRSTN